MTTQQNYQHLIKFLLVSAGSLFVGTVQGVLQVIHPIRLWLDSIGSPYGGPGHMIDPLAHAHINTIGGVVIFLMGGIYYLLPHFSGKPIYSRKLVEHTFWWTTLGIAGFYSTLMVFGIWEGNLTLVQSPDLERVHHYYGLTISLVSTAMGVGFWVFFANIYLTVRQWRKEN